MNTLRTDAVVIGGGAAGMLAAAVAASRGLSVLLLEPNEKLGRKLRITGKGRCNLTNNCGVREFFENVPQNPRFLYSAVNAFSPSDTMALFEELGVPLKTERGNRVFPVSDNSHHIAEALNRYMERGGVKVQRVKAKRILVSSGAVRAVSASGDEIECRTVILCTGGLSYPRTGSDGDGYRIARELGHSVTELSPSLVPLESPDGYCGRMQGFSLKNVRLSAYDGSGRLIFRDLGEMLFTHFGVSGPLVLSASAHMRNFANHRYRLEIDLKPGLDEKKLDARILRDFEANANRDFKNSLDGLLGKKMIQEIIELSRIPGALKVNSVTKQQRRRLVELLKAFPVRISGPRPVDEAIITSGGIDVREVNPKTMESKLVRGLYFAGEVLDVDGYTGGFNLQIAWSTAYAAATNALR